MSVREKFLAGRAKDHAKGLTDLKAFVDSDEPHTVDELMASVNHMDEMAETAPRLTSFKEELQKRDPLCLLK